MPTVPPAGAPGKEPLILDGERQFLRVLLRSPDGVGTLADATSAEYMTRPFPDGGRWRGCIPKRLAGRGIVAPVSTLDGKLSSHRSDRKARRRGIAAVWMLIDPAAGLRRLRDLDDYFARRPNGHSRRPGLFDHLDDPGVGPVPC